MKRREFVQMLPQKAAKDEAAATLLAQDGGIGDEIVGFYAQQAIEKALKAWLAHLDVDFPKIHGIETLVDLIEDRGLALPASLGDVTALTPFATVFRYDDLPLNANFDRSGALQTARSVLAFVRARVQDSEDPD